MRCPKCGYNSFDHFDNCKKCGNDLILFKQNYGIKSVLFPVEMNPEEVLADAETAATTADVAVAAATATTAPKPEKTAPATSESDNDDFGFDFMGDTEEDDDLSFDELFEEAPEDEDIEETIEAPKAKEETPDLDDDFGFDPDDESDVEAGSDFSFDDEESESTKNSAASGIEEDPKRPFDLPESPQAVGAPEASHNNLSVKGSAAVVTFETENIEAPTPESQLEIADNYIFEPFEATATIPAATLEVPPQPETAPDLDFDVKPVAITAITAEEETVSIVTAPLDVTTPTVGKRVGAFVYDLVILVTVGICFIVAAEAAMSPEKIRLLPSIDTLIDLSVPYFLVLFFLSFGYFTLFHFLAGQTPGKMLTGTRVETTNGEPLALAQAFLRSVGGLLQLLPAGIGYLVLVSSADKRGWNDKLAGTRVIVIHD